MNDPIRENLLALLNGEGAHAPFEKAVASIPAAQRGSKPNGAPHSAWELLEHLRITLWDMLDFSRNAAYVPLEWPESYWPKHDSPPSAEAWAASVTAYQSHLKELEGMVADTARDLFAAYPPVTGKALFRNVLVIADHNAYHVGQLMYLSKMLES
jgi:hypothetical protein